MEDNQHRTQNLYKNADGTNWLDEMKDTAKKKMAEVPEIGYIAKASASTPYLKDALPKIENLVGTTHALRWAQNRLQGLTNTTTANNDFNYFSDRVKWMQIQFNHDLSLFLTIFNDLKDPISQIEHELSTKYSGASIRIGKTAHQTLRKHLADVSGRSEQDVLKPVQLGASRRVAVATYMRADGGNRKDVTGMVNKRIDEQGNGLFLNIEAWPDAGCAETLFGDVAEGYDKIFWVRDLNGEEYFWPDGKEVYFIPPLRHR